MQNKKRNLALLICFVVLNSVLFSTNRTWTGATSSTWSVSTNWSPNGTPGASDVLTFDNSSSVACNITSSINVGGISITTYTGTITQSSFITVGSSGFSIASGTFAGGSSTITMNGAMSITGGTFTSTSGSLVLNNNFTYSGGTFNHNSGTTIVSAASAATLTGSVTFNNLKITSGDNNSITVTVASGTTLTVNGTLTIEAVSNTTTINTGTINANGHVTLTGSGSNAGGSATININGTGSQTLTGNGSGGVSLPNVIINKSSGTLTLSSVIAVSGNWTYTAGTISAGSSTVYFPGATTISGSHTLNTVTFNGAVTNSNALTLSGNLNIAGSSAYSINSGTINVAGDVTVTDSASGGGGSTIINLNGSGTQTITQSGILQGNSLPSVTINKTGNLTLASGKKVWVGGNWTYTTAGSVTTTSTGVIFTGTSPTITPGSLALNDVTFKPTASSTVTIAASNTLTVNGTLTYAGSSAITVNTGVINPTSHITVTNTVTTGGGSATISITGSNSQTFTGLSSAGLPLSDIVINKSGGTLTFTNTIVAGGNWTWTAGTLATTGSTITFVGTSPTIDGNHTLNNVTFAPTASSTVTIASGKTLTVGGTLTYGGTAATTVNTGTINPTSHITVTNTVTTGGGSATINITGPNNQTFTGLSSAGLPLSNVVINKNHGGTLTFTNTIAVGGNWTWTAGALATTGSTISFVGTSPTIDGTHTLNNVTFAPTATSTLTIASGKTLTVDGTLTYGGTAGMTVNTGTINPTSHITVTNTVTTGGGSATINITGSNSQTFTGLSSAGLPLSNIVINKSGGTLTFTNTIAAGGNWTWTAGTLSTTGSTITFVGTSPTIDGTHTLNNVTFAPTAASTLTIASGKTLTVGGTLTYGGTAGMTVNTGTINPTSHITVTNTVTTGGGSATINITGSNSQTFTGLSSAGLPLSNVVINKSGGTLTFTNTIAVGGNWTWTAGTLASTGSTIYFPGSSTIAGTHTLNAVTFAPSSSSTITVSNALTTSGTLTYGGTAQLTVNTGTINAAGDISVTNTVTTGGGTTLLNISGGSAQAFSGPSSTGYPFTDVIINKSSNTVTLSNNIYLSGNLTYTAGTVATATTSTVLFTGTGSTINTGTVNLYNVKISPSSTVAVSHIVSNTLNVTKTLTYEGNAAITINTGTINASGDITVTNTVTTGGGTTVLNINGNNISQTFTGAATTGLPLGPVYIAKTGTGTLTLNNNMNLSSNLTYTTGTVATATTSTVLFTGTGSTINTGTVNLYNVKISPTSTASVTHTVSNTLNVTKTLTYEGNAATTINTGTINASGDITVTNTVTTGGGTTILNVNGNNVSQVFTGAASTGLPLGPVYIAKTGTGTLTLNNNMNLSGNLTYTTGTVATATTSTVLFTGTGSTINTGTVNLYNVKISPTSTASVTHTVSNSLNVTKTLTYEGNAAITINTGTINASGDIMVTNTVTTGGGSTLLNVTGTVNQTFSTTCTGTVSPLPLGPINLNKTGGTLTLVNNLNAGGDWTYTSASYTLDVSSSTVLFTKTSPTITGTHTLKNVYFNPAASSTVTVTSGTNLTSSGTLGFIGSSSMIINTGTISATGSTINITNTSTGSSFGNGTLLITGTATQTLSCSTGAPIIPNLTINKSSGTLNISGTNVAVGGNLTVTTGTVTVDTANKVSLYTNSNINAPNITFGSLEIAGGTRTLASDINVYKTLSIVSSKTLTAASTAYVINLQGDWSNSGTFTSGTGYVHFTGTKNQTITEPSGGTIAKLKINKNSGNVTLSSAVTVTDSVKFVKGNLITTSTNLLTLNNGCGVSGAGASTGFVSGPIKKVGNTLFTFPVGKSSNYQPIKISAPANTTDAFTGEYFGSGQALGSTTDTTITSLSTCEYWNVTRTTGSSSVTVTPGWNSSSCNIASSSKLITMRVAYWNAAASKWNDVGASALTGNTSSGTVSTATAVNSFGYFTLAKEDYHTFDVYCVKQNIEANQDYNSGYIIASGMKGFPPYHYKWEDNSTDPSRFNLEPGTYSLTVCDSLRDTVRKVITVGAIPTVLTSNNAVITGSSYTNTAVASGGAASVTFGDQVSSGENGWLEFTLRDTSSTFTLGFQPSGNDTSYLLNYKPAIQTADKYISRASMAAYPALKATYDTLSSGYSDSILVKSKKLYVNTGSANIILSNYYSLVVIHNKLYTFVAGATNQRYTSLVPGDILRIGRTSGSITVLKNGVSQTVENSSLGSIDISPQVFVNNTSVGLDGLSGSFSRVGVIVIPRGCSYERFYNYVETKTFDDQGTVISNSKQYFDYLGRSTQSQARLLTDNNTLVTQNLFDGYGRTVATTLAAPIYSAGLCYKPNFIMDASSGAYDYADFDAPITSNNYSGEVNNPASINNSSQGTLGWYYSNNNSSEAFVATAGLPYSRIEYYNDPLNRPKRVAGVGDVLKMGSGYENKMYYMCNAGELEYLFGYQGSYQINPDFTEQAVKNSNLLLYKTITVNADGKEAISYSNSSGKVIATCLSGGSGSCVTNQIVQSIPRYGQDNALVHIPKNKNSTLVLPAMYTKCSQSYAGACGGVITDMSHVSYNLIDQSNGHALVLNTDYSINSTTRAVTFLGGYASKSLYLSMSFNYTGSNACATDLAARYEIDYTDWSLNYYDAKGRLVTNVSPNDVNCTGQIVQVNTIHDDKSLPAIQCGGAPAYSYAVPGSLGSSSNAQVSFSIVPTLNSNTSNQRNSNQSSTYTKNLPLYAFSGLPIDTVVIAPDTSILRQIGENPNLMANMYNDSSFIVNPYLYLTDSLGALVDSFQVMDSTGAVIDSISYERLKNNAQVLLTYNLQYDLVCYQGSTPVPISVNNPTQVTISMGGNVGTGTGSIPFAITTTPVSVTIPTAVLASTTYIKFIPHNIEFNLQGYPSGSHNYNSTWFQYCSQNLGTTPAGVDYFDWADFLNAPSQFFQLDEHILINNFVSSNNQHTFSKKVTYDEFNRVMSSETTDEGISDFVYDNEDKLRFSQNDKQRTTSSGGRFTYVNYDSHARPVEVGEYDPTHSGSGNPYYFRTYAQYAGSTNTAPSGHTDIFTDISAGTNTITAGGRTSQQTYTGYDIPDANLSGYVSGYNQKYVTSKVAKTWNDYSTSWYNYDELGRLTWCVQQTNESLLSNPYKTYNYTYNLQGNLLQTDYNKESSTEKFYHKFDYDADQRLSQVSTSFDASTWTLQDKYYYYLHGPLKREEIQTSLQGVDYVYTINGMLKSINHPSLNNAYDPGQDSHSGTHSSFKNDVFGFTLDYFNSDYSRSSTNIDNNTGGTNLYGGTIKAARWQTQMPASTSGLVYTAGEKLMYQYAYDEKYRLSSATFGTYASSSGAVSFTSLTDFKTDNLSYDRNGNIQTLRRAMQNLNWPAPAVVIDDLTYHYHTTKNNMLLHVDDASSATPLSADIDIPDQPLFNYDYDQVGNCVANNGDGTATGYDVYGQVSKVWKTSNGKLIVRFLYNDKGQRAAKISYDGSGNKALQTNYMYDAAGSLVCTYEITFNTSTPDSTSYTVSNSGIPKDYVLYGAGRLGTYDGTSPRNSSAIYYYEMNDHLGNVRAVYTKNSSNGNADIVSFTDYYPHGGAMPGRNYVGSPIYKYAYQGQEKDNETYLTNFELRQFDPRLGRWLAPDPMGQYHSPYMAMGNNPVSMIDPSGGMDFSWMAGTFGQSTSNQTYNQNPEGSHFAPWQSSQFNGTGDGFFAMDRHYQNHDWAMTGEKTSAYFGNKENMYSGIHDILNTPHPRNKSDDEAPLNLTGPVLPVLTVTAEGFSYDVHAEIQKYLDDMTIGFVGGIGQGFTGYFGGLSSAFVHPIDAIGSALSNPENWKANAANMLTLGLYSGVKNAFATKENVERGHFSAIGQGIGNYGAEALVTIGTAEVGKVIGEISIPIYRVYGEGASMYGKSYSLLNPQAVPFYRNFAGLPNVNSGQFLLKGSIKIRDIQIGRWFASPLDGNTGGLPFELYQNFNQLSNPSNVILKKPF